MFIPYIATSFDPHLGSWSDDDPSLVSNCLSYKQNYLQVSWFWLWIFIAIRILSLGIKALSKSKIKKHKRNQRSNIYNLLSEIRKPPFDFRHLHMTSHAFCLLRYYLCFKLCIVLHNMFTLSVKEQQIPKINSYNFISNCC